MIILGLDPGLRHTGWGVITQQGQQLRYRASGVIHTESDVPPATRLLQLFNALQRVVTDHAPTVAAVEETFVNVNPKSSLILGQARAVSLVVPALAGVEVREFPANTIKKTVTGAGHADKAQVQHMVRVLLNLKTVAEPLNADAWDALATAICCAHHTPVRRARA